MRSTGRKNGFASNLLGANTMQICANWGINPRGGGGVLPYITYTGMCCPKGSPFQRRFLERGIIFRTRQSSTFVSSHLKLFKDRLLLKIRLNALTSKPLYSCCSLEQSIKNWPISRTWYQF